MTITYTQDEVEQMEPATAEGWLEHYNGNITRCAEALGISNATLRKHRDNKTLDQYLIYSGKVYQYKNDVHSNKPDTPSEAELVPPNKAGSWELVHSNKPSRVMKVGANGQIELKKGYKVTRDRKTGRVQYWRRKD